MRKLKTLLTIGLATLALGALAQAPPPHPLVDGPDVGPVPHRPMGPGGPDLLMDPKVQKELNLSHEQIAKIKALRPAPPKPGARPPLPPKIGARPPMPPKPGAEEAKIDAILTPEQRVQLRKMRPTPPAPLARPPKP